MSARGENKPSSDKRKDMELVNAIDVNGNDVRGSTYLSLVPSVLSCLEAEIQAIPC